MDTRTRFPRPSLASHSPHLQTFSLEQRRRWRYQMHGITSTMWLPRKSCHSQRHTTRSPPLLPPGIQNLPGRSVSLPLLHPCPPTPQAWHCQSRPFETGKLALWRVDPQSRGIGRKRRQAFDNSMPCLRSASRLRLRHLPPLFLQRGPGSGESGLQPA